MAKYYQQFEIVDYYTGLQNVTVFFADTLASLYDFETPGTEVDCLTIGALEESLESGTGVFEKSSLKITLFEQAVRDSTDQAFVDFILEARDKTIRRFVQVANSTPTSATIDNSMFFGKVVPKMSANDSDWDSEDYEETINATREWEIEATSLGVEALLELDLKTLITEVVDENPSMFENKPLGVFTGRNTGKIGSGDVPEFSIEYKVKDLFNLNIFFEKLFEKCEEKLLDLYGFEIAIEATAMDLQLKFIAAEYIYVNGDRFSFGQARVQDFISNEDYSRTVRLFDTIADNSIWISKTMLVEKSSETLGFNQYKNVFELLVSISASFGCYLQALQPSPGTILIEFVNRISVIKGATLFPSAIQASLQTEPKSTEKIEKFYSESTSFSGDNDGEGRIIDAIQGIDGEPMPIRNSSTTGKRILLSTTAPILRRNFDIENDDITRSDIVLFNKIGQPWNTASESNEERVFGKKYRINPFQNRTYLHTGIYIKCPASLPASDHYQWLPGTPLLPSPLSTVVAQESACWRPAGAVRLNILGFDYICSLGLFLTIASQQDSVFYETEYTLTVPSIYAFKNATEDECSFKNLTIGSQIELQGIVYTVVKTTRNISDNTTDITLHNSSRFALNEDSELVDLTTSPDIQEALQLPTESSFSNIKTFIAAGSIYEGCAVALNEDGEVVNALAQSVFFNKVVGVALELASVGDLVRVQLSGELECAGWTLTQGEGVFLRSVFTPTNLSATPLLDLTSTEDYFCKIGTALTATRINIQIETGFCFFPYISS